jgi:hypothetical protein
MLIDGFSTIFTIQNLPLVKLYEKEMTPPSISGGGPIDVTNMRSIGWRTNAPKQLKTMGQASASCAYATEAIDEIIEQLQVNQTITITFPDTSTITYWGWIDSFTPSAHKEGDQPTAAVVFHPSLRNVNGVETAPVYTGPTES